MIRRHSYCVIIGACSVTTVNGNNKGDDNFYMLVINLFSFLQGSTSSIALLVLTYHGSIQGNLPYYLTRKHGSLVLALTPRSRIYRQFYSDVMHLWKENQLHSFPQFETVVGKNTAIKVTVYQCQSS